jgi:branched-chain amino acid transport system substrate-binding protein
VDPADRFHARAVRGRDALKRTADPTDAQATVQAIAETELDTIVGPLAWNGANLPPLVGGQWRHQGGDKYDLVIVDNQTATEIPVAGDMEAIA